MEQSKSERTSLLECDVFDEKIRKEDVGPPTVDTNVDSRLAGSTIYCEVFLVNRHPVSHDL